MEMDAQNTQLCKKSTFSFITVLISGGKQVLNLMRPGSEHTRSNREQIVSSFSQK